MNTDHYLSKIERNILVLDKAPDSIKESCRQHILWARDLAKKLKMLDYDVRDKAIVNIHQVLDGDYELMGYTLKNTEDMENGKIM